MVKRVTQVIAAAVLIAATLTACERDACPQGQHWEDRGNYTTETTKINGKTSTRTVWHSRWMCVS